MGCRPAPPGTVAVAGDLVEFAASKQNSPIRALNSVTPAEAGVQAIGEQSVPERLSPKLKVQSVLYGLSARLVTVPLAGCEEAAVTPFTLNLKVDQNQFDGST